MTQLQILLFLDRMNKRLRHENGPPPKDTGGGQAVTEGDGWLFDGVPVRIAQTEDDILDVLGSGLE